jgi:hypothetical protein
VQFGDICAVMCELGCGIVRETDLSGYALKTDLDAYVLKSGLCTQLASNALHPANCDLATLAALNAEVTVVKLCDKTADCT